MVVSRIRICLPGAWAKKTPPPPPHPEGMRGRPEISSGTKQRVQTKAFSKQCFGLCELCSINKWTIQSCSSHAQWYRPHSFFQALTLKQKINLFRQFDFSHFCNKTQLLTLEIFVTIFFKTPPWRKMRMRTLIVRIKNNIENLLLEIPHISWKNFYLHSQLDRG